VRDIHFFFVSSRIIELLFYSKAQRFQKRPQATRNLREGRR